MTITSNETHALWRFPSSTCVLLAHTDEGVDVADKVVELLHHLLLNLGERGLVQLLENGRRDLEARVADLEEGFPLRQCELVVVLAVEARAV